MTPTPIPEEFNVDTTEARPLDPEEARNQLEALCDLRGLLDRRCGDWYRGSVEAKNQERQQRAIVQLTVGIVDELGRLVEGARRGLGDEADLSGRGEPTAVAARAWLGTFE